MELKAEFLGENSLGNKKTGVYDDQMNGFKYENGGDKSDCYIVDLENFSDCVIDKQNSTITNSSRITLQRSLSRKVPQRGAERKLNDRDTLPPASSPRAAQVVSSLSTPEKCPSPTLPMGSQDHAANNHQQQPQHQITIKTGGVNTMADGRMGKRSSFKRSSYSWYSDPKRILLLFATLSSMGTMLLIYFTLSTSKADGVEGVLDWQ
ncbi:uncharacterized protein LOC110731397 [Chenopodium quinoa]|uniref:Uncharacterized protein n=1 Tax=Chenopodium quinoa TaxID=63459 RepID=A0A803M235_CHEQI|nr:uncharacterized protein LOC110731397 [Chenopodium quinoa]